MREIKPTELNLPKPIRVDMDILNDDHRWARVARAEKEAIENAFAYYGYSVEDVEKLGAEGRIIVSSIPTFNGHINRRFFKDYELLFEILTVQRMDPINNRCEIIVETIVPAPKGVEWDE